MKIVVAEQLYSPPSAEERFLPEGPYPVNDREFSWVSIQHGANSRFGSLNLFDFQARTNRSFKLPGRPGFAFSTSQQNVFVAGVERELGLFDIEDQSWTKLCDGIDSDCENTIINDGIVYKDCLIFGTKDLEFKTPKAGLYLFRMHDRKLFKLSGGQTCSNGKFMLAGQDGVLTLVDIDTPTREVCSYHIDLVTGTLGPRHVVLDCKQQPGFPDGMTLSPDGKSIFISFYNPDYTPAGETRQFALDTGEVLATYLTPGAPQATCPQICKFGDRVHLIITTAVEHMSADRLPLSPNSGSLFSVPLDYAESSYCPSLPIE